MKIFNVKSLGRKLALTLMLVIILSTTVISNTSYAGIGALVGGVLIDPICDLTLGLGDGIMSIIQKSIFGINGEISVDLTGKTPWYVWLARSNGSISSDCNWSYNYRRYFGISCWINRNYRDINWRGCNSRYYYNFRCIYGVKYFSGCSYG